MVDSSVLMDNAIATVIILFIILIVWAKLEHKRIMDLLKELREMIREWRQPEENV